MATPVAKPVASPVATPVAKPVASPVATPVAKPVAEPVATPVAEPVTKPVAAVAPMTDAQAMKLISNISNVFPTGGIEVSSNTSHPQGKPGHDYNYDVASVLHKQAPGHQQNNNPSMTQYASFIFTLSQAQTKGSKSYNPALATWMTSNLSKLFPTVKGSLSMADAMKK